MKHIIGLDLSLTKTGIGIITQRATGDCIATADTITSSGHRADDLLNRHTRITELTQQITHHASTTNLAIIEGPVTGTRGGSPVDRYALWWSVASALIRREIPVAVISPKSLKLAIAASGNADKATVAVALNRLWPNVDITSSDVADALALAHLGAVHLGWTVVTLERHRQVKAEWPPFLNDLAVA